MRSMSATAASPVGRLPLRDETRKHIGDTVLLDHLIKHDIDKLVAGGPDRLRRRHNPNGVMEYWLEPGELAQVRREVGVSDTFWVPPPGWKVGDAAAVCPCGKDSEKEASQLGAEVASMRRHYQSLLQWKNTVDKDMVTMSSNLLAMQQELLSMRDENGSEPSMQEVAIRMPCIKLSFRDLANWLGVEDIGLFNFKPSVRPVPLEVHIQVTWEKEWAKASVC